MQTDRLTQLLEFLRDAPGDSFLQYAVATEYISRGDDTTAEKYFRVLLVNDPDYVATYYHLGKLLERAGKPQDAIKVYLEGKTKAKAVKDMHSFSELQGALENAGYEEDDDF